MKLSEGTSNFYYENRCVVVTDGDYEDGNVPEYSIRSINRNKTFPQCPLTEYNDFTYYTIVITPGYYTGACIDYVENESALYDEVPAALEELCDIISKKVYFDEDTWIINDYKYSKDGATKEEVFDYVRNILKDFSVITDEDITNAINETENSSWELGTNILTDEVCEKVNKVYAEKEEEFVNKTIDKIKSEYGYEEYGAVATFSNGETVYKKIDEDYRQGDERTFTQDDEEYDLFKELANKLNELSPNKHNYVVEQVYLDYGSKWMWTTIVDKTADVQVLNPAQWLALVNKKFTIEEIAKDILTDKYCQDKGFVDKNTVNESLKEKEYKGYYLRYYHNSENKSWDDRYQINKSRPYDDADYYYGYSFDKQDWIIVYKNKKVDTIKGSFEDAVDYIDEKNKEIKPRMMHN